MWPVIVVTFSVPVTVGVVAWFVLTPKHPQNAATHWDSLTEAEHAVADLVAEGLSNPKVAPDMFLSRRTVDLHPGHIFRKLGIDSRVVLTRIALEHPEQAS